MQQARSNGDRRSSTRDPDYKPTEAPLPGFYPAPLLVCGSCAALLPNTDRAQQVHRRHHEAIEGALPR